MLNCGPAKAGESTCQAFVAPVRVVGKEDWGKDSGVGQNTQIVKRTNVFINKPLHQTLRLTTRRPVIKISIIKN